MENETRLCACGCGIPVQRKSTWRSGHNGRSLARLPELPNPSGLCQCGCGNPTSIATRNNNEKGHRIGKPVRFLQGHHDPIFRYLIEDRGYKTPCWIWGGTVRANGYGAVVAHGKLLLAHRWVYQKLRGIISRGLVLDHLCRVPQCVNPDHLDPVTREVNNQRGAAAKVTPDIVRQIRRMYDDGILPCQIEPMFNVSRDAIRNIARRRVWTNID